ncbi:MAG: glycosyltransferase family 2 protein [Bacteroidales bacterium]|nr:glycosyltransferase family 2 protein [Bacteroidales bacterium]
MKPVDLCIIIPCYNEEEILEWTYQNIINKLNQLIQDKLITDKSRICFVNDGSKDNTWNIIDSICQSDRHINGLKLSRNFGHQAALMAGLTSKVDNFDCYITIDADLQDDIDAIDHMVLKFMEGFEIVYGVRNNRTTDTVFKRNTAYLFYRLMSALNVETVYNHADFRLIGNRVVNELLNYRETNLFLRSIFPIMGFKSSVVYYKRHDRIAGTTKYPLRKMLAFAWEGITSFSSKPLKIGLYVGIVTFILTIGIIVWALVVYWQGRALPGWVSTVIPIALLGGLQMISIGVLGEYIGKIYIETKRRPRFIIDSESGFNQESSGKQKQNNKKVLADAG